MLGAARPVQGPIRTVDAPKKVCSDRFLGGLSTGREVPSGPPENWLNQPPEPEIFLVKFMMALGVAG